ncbi:class E sortase [Streptomyces sp. NPDC060065]|uniref:class E sortase n=1 Tax=Streptomyces sp. NPDC060065 TaxID=3347050 RepID=UPI0036B71879
MPRSGAFPAALSSGGIILVLLGCSTSGAAEETAAATRTASAATPATPSSPATSTVEPTPATTAAKPAPGETNTQAARTASLAIPAIALKDLRVVSYEGTTDDWPGTRIQNRGVAASPYGNRGGVGPGEVGNYLVTAHRLSADGPLRELPALDEGDSVFVTSGGTVYEYEITESRTTSFRSDRSLAEQRAAVPGFPGERPTQAMITISTCATLEDNAAGNHWRDDRGNPEHRIDKIGVLTSTSTSTSTEEPPLG